MDHQIKSLPWANNRRQTQMKKPNHSRRQVKRFDVLPDDVLLEIFDFYMKTSSPYISKRRIEEWQSLVHVCRRWRCLVLGSPRFLNLRLYCTPETPARNTLDVWPGLPLIVDGNIASSSGADNIIAALGQSKRVSRIFLWYHEGWRLEQVSAAMQVPFPKLTQLRFISYGETLTVIPDSFLGGSAPLLQILELRGTPFPGLPRLLLSANYLVHLLLFNIPHSGYISPEAIVALISVLSSLETLSLGFQSPQSRPDRRPDRETRRPPPKRSVIPALTSLRFKGVIEYLEDLVTRIDTPQVDKIDITLFNQIDFDTPELAQLINRTYTPKHRKPAGHACVQFNDDFARVRLVDGSRTLMIAISCRDPDGQISSMEQICNSLHPLSAVEVLYVEHRYQQPFRKYDSIEDTLWLQLLLSFTAIKYLYLSKEIAPGIAAALQGLVGGRITEVLPSLQNIFVEGLRPSGPFQKKIGQFVAARQISGHPIAISVWRK